jgi:hypothetical protein
MNWFDLVSPAAALIASLTAFWSSDRLRRVIVHSFRRPRKREFLVRVDTSGGVYQFIGTPMLSEDEVDLLVARIGATLQDPESDRDEALRQMLAAGFDSVELPEISSDLEESEGREAE